MNQLFVSPPAQLATYCLLVVLASLAGGWILLAVRLTHLRLQIASSFVAGLMLAMALLHFIPHATHQNHSIDQTVRFVLAGFLVMFLLQRFLPHHHHDVAEEAPEHRGNLSLHRRRRSPARDAISRPRPHQAFARPAGWRRGRRARGLVGPPLTRPPGTACTSFARISFNPMKQSYRLEAIKKLEALMAKDQLETYRHEGEVFYRATGHQEPS